MAMSVGAVVGEHVAQLREARRLTQYELVRELGARGIVWTRSKVAGLEAGKRSTVDFGDVVLLAYFFGVPVWEFLMGVGEIKMESAEVPLPRILAEHIARGEYSAVDDDMSVPEDGWAQHDAAAGASGRYGPDLAAREADEALARRLNADTESVVAAAMMLWGRTLTSERDRRTDALSADMPYLERQAHRGHITRQLAAEVETLLLRDDSGSVSEPGEEAAGQ